MGSKDAESLGWARVRHTVAGSELAGLLEDASLAELDDASLIDAVAGMRRLANFYEAGQLAVMDELRRRRNNQPQHEWTVKPDTQAVLELAPAVGQSRQRIRSRMQLASSLRNRLPRIWALLEAGRIDEYAASEIDGELRRLTDPDLVPQVEAQLLGRILPEQEQGDATKVVGKNVAQIRTLARKLVARAEPEEADKRFRARFADRTVCFTPLEDGMGELVCKHSGPELEAISHRLSLLARQCGADARTMDQRRADIAVDLLLGRATCSTPMSHLETGDLADDPSADGAGGDPSAAPAHTDQQMQAGLVRQPGCGVSAQVNITVPIQTLMGVCDVPGELLSGEPVPASLARRIAADPTSTWYRLLTDESGNLLDLSTKAYRASPPLTRAITARDRTCIGAGCTTSAQTAETDHTVEASQGGHTSYTNTGRACDDHNRFRNINGVDLSQPAPGEFRWQYPTGHVYTTTPEPYPVAGWPDQWEEPASATQLQAALALYRRHEQQLLREQILRMRRQHDERRIIYWRSISGGPDEPDDDPERPSMDAETLELVGTLLA